MKSILFAVFAAYSFLLFVEPVHATVQTTYNTQITCQEDEGDQWLEVGIVDNSGLTAYVVKNDSDANDTAKLITKSEVFTTTRGGITVYQDADAGFYLKIYQQARVLRADLTILEDGSGRVSRNGLFCYPNSTISF